MHRQAAPQDLEGAPTKCGGCAWMILKSHNSSSWPQRFWSRARYMSRPFLLATMTALQKRDCGVGTTFRRLVAKGLARQFGLEVEKAFAVPVCPLDKGKHRLCWARDSSNHRPESPETVLSIDGIGACEDSERPTVFLRDAEGRR